MCNQAFIRALAVAACGVFMAGSARASRPVARWDVVPDQRFESVFNAGVCAFHIEGVKVEFRVGGALLHTAEAPTLNPRTGVWEFCCPLDASDYPDGAVILNARAVPLAAGHENYDLPTLQLYANSGGTLTVATIKWVDAVNGLDTNPGTRELPYQSLAKAVQNTPYGGTINVQTGSYSSASLGGGSTRPYWTVIQAAPGVDRDAVEVGPGRPGTQRLRWRNLALYCDYEGGYTTILTGENGSHSVWLENCRAYNKQGRWAASAITFGNRYVSYVTGGITTEMANGPGGSLVRDHLLQSICSDAWTGSSRLVVNCRCVDIDRGPTDAHPDFHQSYAVDPNWCEDVILYNVRGFDCISQGLFGSRLRNSAFVNVLFEKLDTVMYSQYSGPMENVLFIHLTIVNQSWLWRSSYEPVDVQVVNGIFQNMSDQDGQTYPGLLTVDGNHFVDPTRTMGTNVSSGDAGYRDASADNYRLVPDSPARGNARPLQCVPADIDGGRRDPLHPNRGVFADPSKGTDYRVLQRAVREQTPGVS